MAATTFIKDPLVNKSLKQIAYVSGTLSSVIGILGLAVAFSKSKTLVTLAIVITSICLVTLISLAAHALAYLGYHVSLLPTNTVLLFMNRTWIGFEGENFQKTVNNPSELYLLINELSIGKVLWTVWTKIISDSNTTIMLRLHTS